MNYRHELSKNGHYLRTQEVHLSLFNNDPRSLGNPHPVEDLPHSNVRFNFANIQTKLKVSHPGDIYEQEADRVAEQIINSKVDHSFLGSTKPNERVDLKCSNCLDSEEENKEKMKINRNQAEISNSPDELEISGNVAEHVANALEEPGSPLESSPKRFMESRFGFNFGFIRIHTGINSSKSASALNALSYTIGNDIVFGEGQYMPTTSHGTKLLAHELVHVIQQGAAIRSNALRQTSVAKNLDNSVTSTVDDPIASSAQLMIQRQVAKPPPPKPKDEKDKRRVDAFDKECPDTVEIVEMKSIPQFNKTMFDAGFRTYFGLVTNMKAGPKDRYESCISEELTVEENTCGNEGNMAGHKPCEPKTKCMQIGKTCGGDPLNAVTFECSNTTFVDLHRTHAKKSLLEGTNKTECHTRCLQRYGCGGKEIGSFHITRNFKKGDFNKIAITLGTIEKVKAGK